MLFDLFFYYSSNLMKNINLHTYLKKINNFFLKIKMKYYKKIYCFIVLKIYYSLSLYFFSFSLCFRPILTFLNRSLVIRLQSIVLLLLYWFVLYFKKEKKKHVLELMRIFSWVAQIVYHSVFKRKTLNF